MKHIFNDLKIPVLLTLTISLCALVFLPLMPIDETRYASVAWEMWTNHSFLIPHLNGVPYSHKPPLLFWLIQGVWKIFGVHAPILRLIPMVFNLLSLVTLYKISLQLWPGDRKTASSAVLILASTLIWAIWSCAIMFDILLTFWILLGILGLLRESAGQKGGWFLLAIGTAGGLLAKGPAVFVYLLSLSILHPLWLPQREHPPTRKIWYPVCGALVLGLLLALVWVIPAAVQGGEEYRHELLWDQTAHRIASSFAHHRPFWWYFPILPTLFLPWILVHPTRPRGLTVQDPGIKLCLLWIGVPFLIFSLISGKQIHYLIPAIPAAALFLGKHFSTLRTDGKPVTVRLIGVIYILISILALSLPHLNLGGDLGDIRSDSTLITTFAFFTAGLFLSLTKFKTIDSAVKGVATTTILATTLLIINAKLGFLASYEITPVAQLIQQKIASGQPVVHIGNYHSQYHFLGRITEPIPVIDKKTASAKTFATNHPHTLFISYRKNRNPAPEYAQVVYSQRFRGKTVMLWEMKQEYQQKQPSPVK